MLKFGFVLKLAPWVDDLLCKYLFFLCSSVRKGKRGARENMTSVKGVCVFSLFSKILTNDVPPPHAARANQKSGKGGILGETKFAHLHFLSFHRSNFGCLSQVGILNAGRSVGLSFRTPPSTGVCSLGAATRHTYILLCCLVPNSFKKESVYENPTEVIDLRVFSSVKSSEVRIRIESDQRSCTKTQVAHLRFRTTQIASTRLTCILPNSCSLWWRPLKGKKKVHLTVLFFFLCYSLCYVS